MACWVLRSALVHLTCLRKHWRSVRQLLEYSCRALPCRAAQVLAQLAAGAMPVRLVAGHDLYEEGDEVDGFYVMQEGEQGTGREGRDSRGHKRVPEGVATCYEGGGAGCSPCAFLMGENGRTKGCM